MGIKRAVSLYSFQDAYATKRMSVEDMFQEMKSLDVEGVELISDQMIKNAPFPSQESIDTWKGLCAKYDIKGVCNSIFINSTLYRNRKLTDKEQVALLKNEIKCAHDLGFDTIRLVSQTNPQIIEPCMDYMAQMNVRVGLEIHAGISFEFPLTAQYIEVMKKVKSPYVGLVIDCGIFCNSLPRISSRYFEALGANPEISKFIDKIFESGSDYWTYAKHYASKAPHGSLESIPPEARELIKTPIDIEVFAFAGGYERTPFSVIDEYLPYMFHVHGKCYEMTEDNEEYSILYKDWINYLKEKNYDGYIATEYEGNRFIPIDEPIPDTEQVRRHQTMLKKYIGS